MATVKIYIISAYSALTFSFVTTQNWKLIKEEYLGRRSERTKTPSNVFFFFEKLKTPSNVEWNNT